MELSELARIAFERMMAAGEPDVRKFAKAALEEYGGIRPTTQQVRSLVSEIRRLVDDQAVPTNPLAQGTGGGRRVIRDARGL